MRDGGFDPKSDLLLLGAGGHAKVVIEAIRLYNTSYNIIGITEVNEDRYGQLFEGISILGSDNIMVDLYNKGLRKALITLGCVGNPVPREKLYCQQLAAGLEPVNVFHGKSIVSPDATFGKGNVVLAGAIVNAGSAIGDNCILNSGCVVEHDCIIKNNVHIAPGARLSGGVVIEDNCMVGIGSSIIQGVRVGKGSIIGAGSVVIRDIPPGTTVVGVPARIINRR